MGARREKLSARGVTLVRATLRSMMLTPGRAPCAAGSCSVFILATVVFALSACSSCDAKQNHQVDTGGTAAIAGAGGAAASGIGGDQGGIAGQSDSAGSPNGGVGDVAGTAGTAGSSGSACDLLGVPGMCVDATSCDAAHTATTGRCGAIDLVCCTPFAALLCDASATPRPDPNAGKTTEAPGIGGCPDGMLAVSTFCIDQYEATLIRTDTAATWCPYDNPGSVSVRALSVVGTVPQVYISAIQAGDACTNAGKRLCTDAEWLRACQGAAGTVYPYGDTRITGRCNDERDLNPVVQYFGTTDTWIYSEIGNSCLDQLPQTTEPAGSASDCVTPEGVYDMVGNVDEWTADPNGTFRGGSFVDSVVNGSGCLYATTAHDTSHWDYTTGFRCCADLP